MKVDRGDVVLVNELMKQVGDCLKASLQIP